MPSSALRTDQIVAAPKDEGRPGEDSLARRAGNRAWAGATPAKRSTIRYPSSLAGAHAIVAPANCDGLVMRAIPYRLQQRAGKLPRPNVLEDQVAQVPN